MGNKKATEQKTTSTPEVSPQMKGILYGNGQTQPNQNMQGMQLAPAPPMAPAAFPPGQAPMGFPSPPQANTQKAAIPQPVWANTLHTMADRYSTAPPAPQDLKTVAGAFKGQNTGHHTGAMTGMARGAMGPGGNKGVKGK